MTPDDIEKLLMGLAVVFGAVATVFAPIILSESSRRGAMVLAGILSFSGIGVAAVSMAGGILGIAVALPIAALLWLGGMICGLAAFIDRALKDTARVAPPLPSVKTPGSSERREPPVFRDRG